MSGRKRHRFQVTLLTADELAGCRERGLAEASAGRTRGLSLEWIESQQRETERAFREGRQYHAPLEKTGEELMRLEELKWLPFKRDPHWNAKGGTRPLYRRSVRRRRPRD